MRFGINTFLFTCPFTNRSTRLFPKFQSWGFDSVEIPIGNLAQIDPAYVGAQLARHGLACGAVTPCLGPDKDIRGTTAQQCAGLEMIHDVNSPALKLHLDTFHMNIEEKDPAGAIRRAGHHLGHFHACGCDRGTPGGDHIDWNTIAAALKSIRYQGHVVIESFTADVKIIARAAAIWRRIEPTREEIAWKGVKFLRRVLKQP